MKVLWSRSGSENMYFSFIFYYYSAIILEANTLPRLPSLDYVYLFFFYVFIFLKKSLNLVLNSLTLSYDSPIYIPKRFSIYMHYCYASYQFFGSSFSNTLMLFMNFLFVFHSLFWKYPLGLNYSLCYTLMFWAII